MRKRKKVWFEGKQKHHNKKKKDKNPVRAVGLIRKPGAYKVQYRQQRTRFSYNIG